MKVELDAHVIGMKDAGGNMVEVEVGVEGNGELRATISQQQAADMVPGTAVRVWIEPK